jgi:hypothetical protein
VPRSGLAATSRRWPHLRILATVPSGSVCAAFVLLSTAAALLSGCTGRSHDKTEPRSVTFREPTSPGDAATEFALLHYLGEHDLAARLDCPGRPSYGALPLMFTSGGPSKEEFEPHAIRVQQTASTQWRVVVSYGRGPGPHATTTATVINSHARYRVCTFE